MLSGWEAPWLHRTERAKARQSKLVTHTFLTVDTPGTPPGTPVCILVPNRARLGPYGADGRIGRPHRIPGAGKGLKAYFGVIRNRVRFHLIPRIPWSSQTCGAHPAAGAPRGVRSA